MVQLLLGYLWFGGLINFKPLLLGMFLVFFCPFFKVKTNLNLYSLGDQARPSGTMKINSNKSEIQTRHNKHTAQ